MAVNNEELAKLMRQLSKQLAEVAAKLDPKPSQTESIALVYRWAKAEYCTNGKIAIAEKHLRTKLLQSGIAPQYLESTFNALIQSGYLEYKDGDYPNRHYAPYLPNNSQGA
jgi:hypothetical protein